MNYDSETTKKMIAAYQAAEDKKQVIKDLANQYKRSEKSIIGKLAREKVYEKNVYVNKLGESPETKKEIIARLAAKLMLDPEKIQGLEKAPKLELKLVEKAILDLLFEP